LARPSLGLATLPCILLLLTLLSLPQAGLHGQTVTVQVTDSVGGSAVGAGFVVVLDSAGREVRRVLTMSDGTFRIALPGPGQYQLRSERIGYRSATTAPIPAPADLDTTVTLAVARLPSMLAPIAVSDSTECVVRPEEGRRVATLWEEAMKVLRATSWTAREGGLAFHVARYSRELNRNLVTDDEEVDTLLVQSDQAFSTESPEVLRDQGFVRVVGREVFWEGLDANVMVSSPFLDTHCFRVVAAERDTTRVGLAFEPVSSRESIPEVAGTLWLDAATAELRTLQFRYVNLRFDPQRAGGGAEFTRLSDGRWIVWNWWVRIPRLGSFRFGSRARVRGYREDAASVLQVYRFEG